jgi:hypothetical protein
MVPAIEGTLLGDLLSHHELLSIAALPRLLPSGLSNIQSSSGTYKTVYGGSRIGKIRPKNMWGSTSDSYQTTNKICSQLYNPSIKKCIIQEISQKKERLCTGKT